MQFKCNISAKCVTPVQITHCELDYDWLNDNRKFSKPIISYKMVTKILCRNLKKIFSNEKKMALRKIFWHFLHVNFVMFNLELICTCQCFKKLKLHSPKWLGQFQLFEKLTHVNYCVRNAHKRESSWIFFIRRTGSQAGGLAMTSHFRTTSHSCYM